MAVILAVGAHRDYGFDAALSVPDEDVDPESLGLDGADVEGDVVESDDAGDDDVLSEPDDDPDGPEDPAESELASLDPLRLVPDEDWRLSVL